MKYISLVLIVLLCSLGCMAKSNSKISQSDLEEIEKGLQNEAIPYLLNEIAELQKQIAIVQAKLEKVKDRSATKPKAKSTSKSLAELYPDRYRIQTQLNNLDEQKTKAYRLAFRMMESLMRVYDEKENNRLIEEASENNTVLKEHQEEFDNLVAQVNDYSFYMMKLAQVLQAAKADNFQKSAEELANSEGASYLLEIPYTADILNKYIYERGDLSPIDKKDLLNLKSVDFSFLNQK